MRPMSRRQVLQLSALGVAGVVIGGVGLSREIATAPAAAGGGAALAAPPQLRSSAGLLRVELEAAERTVQVAGRRVTVLASNTGLPGPTLRLRPGDRLQVRLINRLPAATNLHVHGLHVSPEANGDNPFVTIGAGESFDYDYQLPEDHPTGTFWYHPHLHGSVADQVFGGLYGAIVVEESVPVPAARERLLVISDISFDPQGRVRPASLPERMMGREGDLLLVNGQSVPRLAARPGERERWRIVNACTSRYLRLAVDGQQTQLLGIDSGRSQRPADVTEVVLAPGNRAELLLTLRAGVSELRTSGYDRGSMGMMGGASATSPAATLATLVVEGAEAGAAPAIPDGPAPRDLRGIAVARRRELTFGMDMGMDMGGMLFTIDGKKFDPERVDQQVQPGSVEEWTLRNTSPMDHPVHLHVWPMQLIEENGRTLDQPTWRDVVNVPARGTTVIRVAFDTFTGRTVYHCHILDHEDAGMMGIVEAR